jgi:predicted glutamine amidotransferase
MCRLFGFRSVIPSQVHRSLVLAENALGYQSHKHPDGWGVAYYVDGCPHLTRSAATALGDTLFHRLSGVVASETVLAHVRQATQGKSSVLNSHPFQYGRWVGAHNGDIPNLEAVRPALRAEIAPGLLRFVLGDTDSELLFFQFLSRLLELGPLGGPHPLPSVVRALRQTVRRTREICDRDGHRALLTLLITDGQTLAACQGGKQLYYSTYKRRCADRDSCSSLSAECEAPTLSGHVNHLIVSSEPLQGENLWIELGEGDVVAIDQPMRVVRARLDRDDLPTLGLDVQDSPKVHLTLAQGAAVP